MPKPRPSDWTKEGDKLLDVQHLYTAETIDRIVTVLNPSSMADRAVIERRLLAIAAGLNADLYYRQRPTSGEKRAALGALASETTEALGRLRRLDHDSRSTLADAAIADKELEPDDLPREINSGEYRIGMVEHKLAKLLMWIEAAAKSLEPERKGKKLLESERHAVHELMKLWRDHHPGVIGIDGRRKAAGPTGKQLRALADAALRPVLEQYGSMPSLESICEELI